MTRERTLQDYRPQHDPGCDFDRCVECNAKEHRHFDAIKERALMHHRFVAKPCSCGLDTLLASLLVQPEGALPMEFTA